MGMTLNRLLYLKNNGFLKKQGHKLLDIGTQNVFHINRQQIDTLIGHCGTHLQGQDLENTIQDITYRSTIRPNQRVTFLSEVTDILDNFEYNSFDICAGLKTEIIDLNFAPLPLKYKEYYDTVLNFGTTEHIFNQFNCFSVIHDATAVGGVMYHDLPGMGYLHHGYYCYTPLFFEEMAKANDYEIVDLFLSDAGSPRWLDSIVNIRDDEDKPLAGNSVQGTGGDRYHLVVDFNIRVALKKTKPSSFRLGLEIATAHGSADSAALQAYAAR